MDGAQGPARPPFAFPLCRDSLCSSIGYDLWLAPIRRTLRLLGMLRSKRYYARLSWIKRPLYDDNDDHLPVLVLAQEHHVEDGDKWLSEVLDLDNKSLLDFLAEVFIEYLEEKRGTYESVMDIIILLVAKAPDTMFELEDVDFADMLARNPYTVFVLHSIDFVNREIVVMNKRRDFFTYPMPRDISPYSDAEVGDTEISWGALIRAAAVSFFAMDRYRKRDFIDIINRHVIGRARALIRDISISLAQYSLPGIVVNGKRVVFVDNVQGEVRKRRNPELSISIIPVNNICLPADFWLSERDVFEYVRYEERYFWQPHVTFFCPLDGQLAFLNMDGLYGGHRAIKVNVKSRGKEEAELALNEYAWVVVEKDTRTGVVEFDHILHLSHLSEREKEDISFVWETYPISKIELILEHCG